jgi:Bacterial TSP3 repeat
MNTITKRAAIVTAALAVAVPGAAIAASSDRDGDGMPNSWEQRNSLRVNQNDARRDVDRDELSNLREYRLRTNPRDADTDNDGAEDGAERQQGTNPRVANQEGEGGRRDCPKDRESGEQPEQPQQQPGS